MSFDLKKTGISLVKLSCPIVWEATFCLKNNAIDQKQPTTTENKWCGPISFKKLFTGVEIFLLDRQSLVGLH